MNPLMTTVYLAKTFKLLDLMDWGQAVHLQEQILDMWKNKK